MLIVSHIAVSGGNILILPIRNRECMNRAVFSFTGVLREAMQAERFADDWWENQAS
jgi:hypothetical protein